MANDDMPDPHCTISRDMSIEDRLKNQLKATSIKINGVRMGYDHTLAIKKQDKDAKKTPFG